MNVIPSIYQYNRLGLISGGFSPSRLDPDAAAYVAAVKAAGVDDAHLASLGMPSWSVSEPAINAFVLAEKAAGRWTDLGMLYLPIWGITDANAICLVTRASLSFIGGFSNDRGYWQPNGTTGYANTSRTCGSINQTVASASLFALLTQAGSGSDVRVIAHAFNGLSQVHEIQHSATANSIGYSAMSTTDGGRVLATQTRANQTGIIIASRQGGNRSVYRRSGSGFATLVSTAGADAGTLPTGPIKFARSDFSGGIAYNDARYGAMGASVGWDQTRSEAFSAALKTLWETCTGLTLEGAEYIAALRSAGATVTSTQESAIHAFIKAGKSDGWYSSLKRLYLPIWASVEPNAIDMISLTSGTFVGAVNHEAGYVQGDGSAGYFNLGASPSTLGLTTASGSLFYLKYDNGAATGFRRNIGVENSALQISTMSQSNTVHAFDYNTTATGRLLTGSIGLLGGVFVGSRQGGDRRIERRYSAGFVSLANASGADAGTIPTLNFYALAHNLVGAAANFSDDKLGSYGAASGLTATQAEAFTLSLKDLWETCTGLTLP